jgi:PAS domain S-box-containing protein
MDAKDAKILIVDDEPRNLDALEAMLEPIGCSCVRAQSADEALLALLRHEFAAMVLDIRMPAMSGIELARLIKQRRRTQDVPILFLTAHLVDDEDVLRGYGAGAVDYLSKPVKPDILRSKIAVFVELHRKTVELASLNSALESEIAERQRAQVALQQANQELELRVRERTAELTVAHRGLRETVERLRLALEVAEMAAWEWDVQNGRMTWSHDPETLFGFPHGAFGVEQRLFTAMHADDRVRMEEALAAGMTTGAYAGEYRIVHPDGSIAWITESGRAIRADDGSVEKMVGVSRDVTADREAAQERERLLASEQRARAAAEQQGRLKDDFLATLSHELRTPMNVVLGWLDILASGAPIRDLKSTLGLIRRNAQHQAKLIDELLDMNRLVSGNLRLDLAITDIGAALQSTIQGLKPAAEAKNIQLSVVIETPPVQVAADSQRVQQIMWNLVHNAIKFTEPGGRVESSVRRIDRQVHIVVRDTGRGIAIDFLPHVFERFRQEDSSTTREFFGLGLGLSISKHLVEAHGGTIEAQSDGHGCGATFTVKLPAGTPAAVAAPEQVGLSPNSAHSLSA